MAIPRQSQVKRSRSAAGVHTNLGERVFASAPRETQSTYARGMSPSAPFKQTLFGPSACCDAYAQPKWDVGTDGSLCFWCKNGIFMHGRFWLYTFQGETFVCATPLEELSLHIVRTEWEEIARTTHLRRGALPLPLQAALNGTAERHANGCTTSGPLFSRISDRFRDWIVFELCRGHGRKRRHRVLR